MKLQITRKQFNELSEKGKDYLANRIIESDIKFLDKVFPDNKGKHDIDFLKMSIDENGMLLSIGQMIEILIEFNKRRRMVFVYNDVIDEDFCDELWKEIKKIIPYGK